MPDAAVTTPKKRGPKTPEGKARSKMNALKHGLRARDFALLPEEVTKHNPPWMRGQYLSYYRPPVPAHLFDPDYVDENAPAPALPAAVPPAPRDTIPALRDRVARLLDRDAPRLPEEFDLAEAICAIKWPKWPEYRGPIDLALLRRALVGTIIDGPTLNWLGGKEIVRECGATGSDAR